jgi:transcriptional regulator of acetoin/glycerol metabolism
MEEAYLARDELEAIEAHNRQVLRSISKANGARYTFDDIVAIGENVMMVKSLAQRAAPTDAPVLLSAESGSGKELYAQAIHNASYRKNEVFVAINCANFNSNILESELFGYAEGAFTGAKKGGGSAHTVADYCRNCYSSGHNCEKLLNCENQHLPKLGLVVNAINKFIFHKDPPNDFLRTFFIP